MPDEFEDITDNVMEFDGGSASDIITSILGGVTILCSIAAIVFPMMKLAKGLTIAALSVAGVSAVGSGLTAAFLGGKEEADKQHEEAMKKLPTPGI